MAHKIAKLESVDLVRIPAWHGLNVWDFYPCTNKNKTGKDNAELKIRHTRKEGNTK